MFRVSKYASIREEVLQMRKSSAECLMQSMAMNLNRWALRYAVFSDYCTRIVQGIILRG